MSGTAFPSASPWCRTRPVSSTRPIPEKYWDAGRAFPLEENAPLVASLREHVKAGRVTIAQHGYTHEDFPDGHEFQAAPDLESRLARGQAYLERVLDTRIRVFVPPHNALSKRGLAAVGAAGPQPAGLVSLVPPVDAALGCAHAGATGGASSSIATKTGRSKAIAWCIRMCCAIASMPSSAATA